MPHFPRRQSPTTGIPPELMSPPKAAHAPIPVARPPADRPRAEPAGNRPPRLRIGLDRISPRTFKPDEKTTLRTMLGKEPYVDPHTGQLVLDQPPAPNPPPVGLGG